MKLVKACVCQMRRELQVVRGDVMMLDKVEEGVEHKISILEEKYTNMDKRLMVLEKYMCDMASHVNGAIERINTLHVYLQKQQEETEQCLSSDDEFDFDEYEPKDVTMGKNNEV